MRYLFYGQYIAIYHAKTYGFRVSACTQMLNYGITQQYAKIIVLTNAITHAYAETYHV